VPERDYYTVEIPSEAEPVTADPVALAAQIQELEKEMREAARRLDFERAAELRDRVRSLRRVGLGVR
jgi:excinuclease ABC subunit B